MRFFSRFLFNSSSSSNEAAAAVAIAAKKLGRKIGQPTSYTHPWLVKKSELVAGFRKSEFMNRISKLIHSSLSHEPNCAILLSSDVISYMSNDIPWNFHQRPDFAYLTGFYEPDSLLLLKKTTCPTTSKILVDYHLFVQERNASKELWDGPRAGTEGAKALFLPKLGLLEEEEGGGGGNEDDKKSTKVCEVVTAKAHDVNHSHEILKELLPSVNTIFIDIEPVVRSAVANNSSTKWKEFFAQQILSGHNFKDLLASNPRIYSATPLLETLRLVKSKSEISVMRESAHIAAEGFRAVMSRTEPGVSESYLECVFEGSVKLAGASLMAYPPVVAAGKNALTIHYINNTDVASSGDLILMDAGCEYLSYCSDITRTWPASGKFSEAQKIIYGIVLSVNKLIINQCKEGVTLDQLQEVTVTALAKALISHKILPKDEKYIRKIFQVYPHHVSHYLGMDVHDTNGMSRSIPLKEGMVITIEPGLYFPEHDKDDIIPIDFRGIGIRIEDNIVIQGNGKPPEVLTEYAPKELDEIEALMAQGNPFSKSK